LKTFAAHRVFGTSVVTALTAQNTVGVRGIRVTPVDFVAEQLDAVVADLRPAAVKTGMLATREIIEFLVTQDLPQLVVDPVLVSTSGSTLFDADAVAAYPALFARATLITPNLWEAGVLLGRELSTVDDMARAARDLSATGARCVVVKGGHADGDAIDVFCYAGEVFYLAAPRIRTVNNHGTGCTFAAAAAAHLALGAKLPEALRGAKNYVTRALAGSAAWRLGAGCGPLSWQTIPSRGRKF
jgi:hydroxymethylpyrimidine/phosphomethylpyrimidine kinase